MRFILIFCIIMSSVVFHIAHSQEEYPKTAISNNLLEVDIYLPDAEKGYYRGTRFEWSGLVQEVRFKGHRFFGDWKYSKHDPNNHDDVNGIPGEFSMGLFGVEGPPGYNEAKPGEPFLKIGVGLLEKIDDKQYSPFEKYHIVKPFEWDIKQGTDWIEFSQEIEPFQGMAYSYNKKTRLLADSPDMLVEHHIKNSGTQTLSTTHYCHNFIKIDGEPINQNYVFFVPFPLKLLRNFVEFASVVDTGIVLKKELVNKALFSEIGGYGRAAAHNSFVVTNRASQARILMESSVSPHIYNFYAARYAICPEPFVRIQLEPGESMDWTNQYTFRAEVELNDDPLEWPLEVRIPGGIDSPKMPLKEFLSQIYFKTGVKFTIDEGIEAFVQAKLPDNPTIQAVLESALKENELLYKKLYSGVIRIYRSEE